MKQALLLALPLAIATTGCIPEHDYEGDYEMTYDLTLDNGKRADVRAGQSDVRVRHGLNTEYLLDLGPKFCRIEGSYVKAMYYDDWPYLDIRPQECFFGANKLSISGSAALDKDEDRFSIVLSGIFEDGETGARGDATLELTESW